jgi:hypothetical protein
LYFEWYIGATKNKFGLYILLLLVYKRIQTNKKKGSFLITVTHNTVHIIQYT